MKLYECKNNCYVRILDDAKVPPAAPEIAKDDVIHFGHIDGMYSFCHDRHGNVVHVAAWTEVETITEQEAKKIWES